MCLALTAAGRQRYRAVRNGAIWSMPHIRHGGCPGREFRYCTACEIFNRICISRTLRLRGTVPGPADATFGRKFSKEVSISSNWRHSFITRRGKRQWLFALWSSFLCGWPRTFRRGIRKRRCRRIWSEWRKLSERKFIQRMNDLPPGAATLRGM